jgi:hypothetical protein
VCWRSLEEALESEHLDLTKALENYALLLRAMDRAQEAEPLNLE